MRCCPFGMKKYQNLGLGVIYRTVPSECQDFNDNYIKNDNKCFRFLIFFLLREVLRQRRFRPPANSASPQKIEPGKPEL